VFPVYAHSTLFGILWKSYLCAALLDQSGRIYHSEGMSTVVLSNSHDDGRRTGSKEGGIALSQAEWHQSEEPFRLFIESVQDYAIFMLEPDGRIATWNAGAERAKGYKSSEIIGQHFSRFYQKEDVVD